MQGAEIEGSRGIPCVLPPVVEPEYRKQRGSWALIRHRLLLCPYL